MNIEVIALDLGRLRKADPALDLGMVVGEALALRLRPYLGPTLLRIACNDWPDRPYRQQLDRQAKQWLW
ncbi:MAG: hypothetical protein AB4911_10615 [Oscillochloridaceae bacterium umkhey_bin13]